MSDWDKIEKKQSVPRNDPKISRDVSYGNKITHNLELIKDISRGVDLTERVSFGELSKKESTSFSKPLSRDEHIQRKFKRKHKLKLTPDEIAHLSNLKQYVQEQKQLDRLHQNSGSQRDKHPAERVLTWVFFFLLVGVTSAIGILSGIKSIFILVFIWFIARHYATSFLKRLQ